MLASNWAVFLVWKSFFFFQRVRFFGNGETFFIKKWTIQFVYLLGVILERIKLLENVIDITVSLAINDVFQLFLFCNGSKGSICRTLWTFFPERKTKCLMMEYWMPYHVRKRNLFNRRHRMWDFPYWSS